QLTGRNRLISRAVAVGCGRPFHPNEHQAAVAGHGFGVAARVVSLMGALFHLAGHAVHQRIVRRGRISKLHTGEGQTVP
ncbi:MAG: hypothetical protein RMN25_12925, partial [Anaerolineae bacterium]|nr:hypothetical protein [Thermoflexales bacterium]MDW8408675.1 hypothetical protein [Anaerolineae bacterium]